VFGDENQGADDDVASDADDAGDNAADDAGGQCGGQERRRFLAPGLSQVTMMWTMTVGNPYAAPTKGTRRPETLFMLSMRCCSNIPSLPLPKTLGSPEVQLLSLDGATNSFTKTERAYGQAHLREGHATKIGRGVESLIARWAQVMQEWILIFFRTRRLRVPSCFAYD
jgi:hypothetical protein